MTPSNSGSSFTHSFGLREPLSPHSLTQGTLVWRDLQYPLYFRQVRIMPQDEGRPGKFWPSAFCQFSHIFTKATYDKFVIHNQWNIGGVSKSLNRGHQLEEEGLSS